MHSANAHGRYAKNTGSGFWRQAIGVLSELLIAFAIVCALYVAWQMWWTGAQAEHTQVEARQTTSWLSLIHI